MKDFIKFMAVVIVTALVVFVYTLLSLNEASYPKMENYDLNNDAGSVKPLVEANNHEKHQKLMADTESNRFTEVVIKFLTDVKSTDVLLALFTYLLFKKTSGLNESTRKLWEAGERQINLAEISANSAKTSAEMAIKSADLAIRSQSANVVLEAVPTSWVYDRERGRGFLIRFSFKNTGQTAALDCNFAIAWEIIGIDKASTSLPDPAMGIGTTLGVGISANPLECFIAEQEAKSLWDKEIRCMAHILVRYASVFEPSSYAIQRLHINVTSFQNPYKYNFSVNNNTQVFQFSIS